MTINNDTNEFDFDLRRTIILSAYMKEWGFPESRVRVKRNDEPFIEIYLFKDIHKNKIIRFATVGVSAQISSRGKAIDHELLFVLPNDLGGASEKDVIDYLFDIAVYSLKEDVSFYEEMIIPESPLAPKSWRLRAILIDEARGEPESLEKIHVGTQHIRLLWLIPIYANEYMHIQNLGIDSFDHYCESSSFSLADINRASMIPEK